jgi:hypothetical protein
MREPTVYGKNTARAVALALSKIEALVDGTAVAVVLQAPTGEAMVMFNPGDEVTALDICCTVDWERIRPIVAEYAQMPR